MKNLMPNLKNACKQAKLQPKIEIPTMKHFANPIENPGKFLIINFYWDESYFDKLQYTNKLSQFQNLINPIISQLPQYTKHQWGASDGHLFAIITFHN